MDCQIFFFELVWDIVRRKVRLLPGYSYKKCFEGHLQQEEFKSWVKVWFLRALDPITYCFNRLRVNLNWKGRCFHLPSLFLIHHSIYWFPQLNRSWKVFSFHFLRTLHQNFHLIFFFRQTKESSRITVIPIPIPYSLPISSPIN